MNVIQSRPCRPGMNAGAKKGSPVNGAAGVAAPFTGLCLIAPAFMPGRRTLLVVLTLLALAAPASARTIVLTDEDCERMAVLSADAPRLSWAAQEMQPGVWTTKYTLHLKSNKAFLLAFPIDRLPRDQRITNAELILPIAHVDGEQRLTVRRVVGDWGPGVCWQHRTARPKPIEWTRPGAAAPSSDCAARATANVRIGARGETAVNVTEDVELWYTGAANNNGWVFRVEDQSAQIELLSPLSTYPNGRGSWKLRVTYEPE